MEVPVTLADRPPTSAPFARWTAFVMVGAVAASVHFTVAFTLIRLGHLLPLLANLIGWMTAFCVSFTGHRRLTFVDRSVEKFKSTAMFLAVSLAGLFMNELSLWLLIRYVTDWRVSLGASMLIAAGLTYFLSNSWAFKASGAARS